jgi:hypothetical protein
MPTAADMVNCDHLTRLRHDVRKIRAMVNISNWVVVDCQATPASVMQAPHRLCRGSNIESRAMTYYDLQHCLPPIAIEKIGHEGKGLQKMSERLDMLLTTYSTVKGLS